MHPVLAKRIEIPWPRVPWTRVREGIAILFSVVAIVIALYVLSAPPIIKIIWNAQIRQGQHAHWPRFYVPLLLGLESDTPVIHGVSKWYFNAVWGCGIIFFDDNPSGETDDILIDMNQPPDQGAAVNRSPAGQSDGSGNLSATVAADRAFPAADADLA